MNIFEYGASNEHCAWYYGESFEIEVDPDTDEHEPTVEEIRESEIKEKEHQLRITILESELAQAKAKLPQPPTKRKSPKEIVESKFSKAQEYDLAVIEVEKREIARITKEYPDDPDLQERLIERIKVWAEEQH